MLASLIDLHRSHLYMISDGKGPAPEPLPRPGDAQREADKAPAVEARMRRWEARQRRQVEAAATTP